MPKYPAYWKKGSWKAQCDRCGLDFKAERLHKEWTGLRVCPDCLDMRHPQEFQRAVRDNQNPPWTRPAPTATYLTQTNITIGTIGPDGASYPSAEQAFTNNQANVKTYSNLSATGFNRTYSVSGGTLVDGGALTNFEQYVWRTPAFIGPLPRLVVVFNDTFTAADGTNLANHTPDTGNAWVKTGGTAILNIVANSVNIFGTSTYIMKSGVNTSNLYSISANFSPVVASTGQLTLRFNDDGTTGSNREGVYNNGSVWAYERYFSGSLQETITGSANGIQSFVNVVVDGYNSFVNVHDGVSIVESFAPSNRATQVAVSSNIGFTSTTASANYVMTDFSVAELYESI